jgi:spore maturation protein CgeB
MKFVIFGLSVSSSWGNGHATLWRGLIRALARAGHRVVFYEHDTPYYAMTRDLDSIPRGRLVLYPGWDEIRADAARELGDADVAIVTSFCPHGVEATELVGMAGRPVRVFYDLDTPVTLQLLDAGEGSTAIGPEGLAPFDLVLSYTGGPVLEDLRARLGARRVAPLYGHVDPQVHKPGEANPRFASDLSYLGTYAMDRQATLERLFLGPARARPERRFLIGGAQYPHDFPWAPNIFFVRHLPPAEHPAFYSSSRLTLNVTREAMARNGWCPSGRLFEAAACGSPIVSDNWDGLSSFFAPGEEIIVADCAGDVCRALDLPWAELWRMGRRARDRALAHHTSDRRAQQMVSLVEQARSPAVAEA